ncbi:MAG TPA: M23 family metallopeptidase [Polyangia bacterium]|nr:M23 family metallopeptidase [Polyangia bacterium]
MMFDPEETQSRLPDGAACGACGSALQGPRYVHVSAWAMDVLCSVDCFRTVQRERNRVQWAERRRHALQLAVVVVLASPLLTPHAGAARHPRWESARAAVAPPADPRPAALPPGWYGPEWPPTETSLLASLGHDAWIHPLSGPVRRMPRADSRVFGAVRPGQRPAECRNGHCGVDLGGEIWGEQVHAVHDGVVDFVQRGANPDRGGSFVRLSHHEGTVFTWYFHLAAIPRGLEHGVHVKSGDVIGLLGDTGVKESAPHLHFAITVRPAKDWPERYIDPEPLIALWPVRIPIEGGDAGLVTTLARPGLPLGSANRLAGRHKPAKTARGKHGAAQPAADASGEGESSSEPTSGADQAPADSGDSEAAPEPAADE